MPENNNLQENNHLQGKNNIQENSNIPLIKKPRGKILPILILIIVVILGTVLYTVLNRGQDLAADNNGLKTGSAVRQNLTGDVNITGILDSNGKANISSQVSGMVAQVNVKEGSKVKHGDILASLDKKDFQAQLDQARINVQKAQYTVDQAKIAYNQAESDYERMQQLFETGAISKSDLEQIAQKRDISKSQYDAALNTGIPAAKEALNQAQLTLNKTDLISPLDGTVAACSINPGDFINANVSGTVITLVTSGNVTFAGNVSEDCITQLKLGQKADVQIDNPPGANVSGEISYISPISIPTGQFFPVKITLPNSGGQLKPGMTAGATIHVQMTNAVTVPKAAVFRRDGQTYVFVVKDKKAVQTMITVGLQGDKFVAVTQGLTAGEQIVTDGTDAVLNGMTLPGEP